MESTPYEMKVIAGPDAHTVLLAGEIDYAASLELRPQLQELTSRCCENLHVDLNEVTFIDSEGVKTLIAIVKWMNDRQGQARIVRSSPCVKRVLKIVGLDNLLPIDELAAVTAHDV